MLEIAKDIMGEEKVSDGYWEYITDTIADQYGAINSEKVQTLLNQRSKEGWRLKHAIVNELGKNAVGVGVGDVAIGTNSSHDITLFIFERYHYYTPYEKMPLVFETDQSSLFTKIDVMVDHIWLLDDETHERRILIVKICSFAIQPVVSFSFEVVCHNAQKEKLLTSHCSYDGITLNRGTFFGENVPFIVPKETASVSILPLSVQYANGDKQIRGQNDKPVSKDEWRYMQFLAFKKSQEKK